MSVIDDLINNRRISKGDETETSRESRVSISHYHRVCNLSVLAKVLIELSYSIQKSTSIPISKSIRRRGDLLLVVSLCNPPMNIFLRFTNSNPNINRKIQRREREVERTLPWASAIAGLKVFVARSGSHRDSIEKLPRLRSRERKRKS